MLVNTKGYAVGYTVSHDMTFLDNTTQYILGFFGTGAGLTLIGTDLTTAGLLAAILPALVLLVVNIPRMLTGWLGFYREYKKSQKDDNAHS